MTERGSKGYETTPDYLLGFTSVYTTEKLFQGGVPASPKSSRTIIDLNGGNGEKVEPEDVKRMMK